MRIDQVEVRRVTLPLRFPFETSFSRTTTKQFLLVSVSVGGRDGPRRVRGRRGPLLPARDERDRPPRPPRLPRPDGVRPGDRAPPRGAPGPLPRARPRDGEGGARDGGVGAVGAVATASRCGASSAAGAGRSWPGCSVGLQRDTSALLEKVEAEVAAGYRRVKVKIKPGSRRRPGGGDPRPLPPAPAHGGRQQRLHARRRRAPPRARPLLADHDRAAARLGRHRRPRGAPEDLATPICLDESIRSADDARRALDLGACRVVNVKVGRVGGFAGAIAVARRLPCAGRPGVVRRDARVGHRPPRQRAPPDAPRLHPARRHRGERAVLRGGPRGPAGRRLREGQVAVPEGPGIGHAIVWPRVERATDFREAWRRP